MKRESLCERIFVNISPLDFDVQRRTSDDIRLIISLEHPYSFYKMAECG